MKVKTWVDKSGNVEMSEIKLSQMDINFSDRKILTDKERKILWEVDGRQRIK